jgi:hypothetical protein
VRENKVSRKIFGPKRDKVTGERRKPLNEDIMICTLHHIFSGDKIEKNEMGGACSTYGGEESCIQGFGGET